MVTGKASCEWGMLMAQAALLLSCVAPIAALGGKRPWRALVAALTAAWFAVGTGVSLYELMVDNVMPMMAVACIALIALHGQEEGGRFWEAALLAPLGLMVLVKNSAFVFALFVYLAYLALRRPRTLKAWLATLPLLLPALLLPLWRVHALEVDPGMAKSMHAMSGAYFQRILADKTVSGEGFSVSFDPKSGFIRSYRLRNVELLAGPVRPNFYRAATDNDLGVRQTGKYPDSQMWAKAEPQLTGFALTPGDSEVKAIADYTLPNVGAKLNLTYSIAADGSVRVSETMTADPARKDVADLMRFGMAFETPGMFDAVEYYGRGPMENYADRSGAAFVGRYAQRVADQFHMKYVSPQESGTRSGLRWWRLTDDSGLGVEICSDRHFSASAIPFAIPQLDNGSPEYVRHPGDLVPDGRTHVNIESVQSGLGCVNSWGRLPRPEYLLPYGDYSFNFLLRPVAGGR